MRSHRSLWWQSGTIKAAASSLEKTCGEQKYRRGFNRTQLHLIFTLKLRWSKPAKVLWAHAWSRFFFQLAAKVLLAVGRSRSRKESGWKRSALIRSRPGLTASSLTELTLLLASAHGCRKGFPLYFICGVISVSRLAKEEICEPSESTSRCLFMGEPIVTQ